LNSRPFSNRIFPPYKIPSTAPITAVVTVVQPWVRSGAHAPGRSGRRLTRRSLLMSYSRLAAVRHPPDSKTDPQPRY
jgi:hypothetical protein